VVVVGADGHITGESRVPPRLLQKYALNPGIWRLAPPQGS
jgi:hypothetical protein